MNAIEEPTPPHERPIPEQLAAVRHDLAGARQVIQSGQDLLKRVIDEVSKRVSAIEERLDGQDVAIRALPTRAVVQDAIAHAWDDPQYVERFNVTMDERQDRQRDQRWREMRGAVRGALKFAGGALIVLNLIIALMTLYIAWHVGMHP